MLAPYSSTPTVRAVTAELRLLPQPVQVGLQVAPGSPAARALEQALGVALPATANTVASAECRDVLWLGPEEWLVIETGSDATAAGAAAGSDLERALRAAVGGDGWAAIVDLSANRSAFELAGAGAVEVLASVCGLDLHPRSFPAGRCAQTLLASAPVILQRLASGPQPRFRILVRPSLARYVQDWLADAIVGAAAAEAGFPG